uniref:NADH dehydrogenase subunit 9 n=1 Tax=Eukaryota sp. BB2 TaxID=1949062 RepID=A0A1W5QHD9_9EUKA|nr:NADH dehydrogenase subunit 9 [Eukaryota sp. BB2]AQL10471.1 NADH dehydrogenase subunit 9 [Eukaryota sp. BB2]
MAYNNYINDLNYYLLLLTPKFNYLNIKFYFDQNLYYVYSSSIVKFLTILKSHLNIRLDYLLDITAMDLPQRSKRFQIVYNFTSTVLNTRLRIKLWIKETESIYSIANLYNGSMWYEREIFDLFGVSFFNHPDLRRILTDYAFEGHPLRKDFPLSGYYELRYYDVNKKIVYQNIKLIQEFRNFNILSPWDHILEFKAFDLYKSYSNKHKPLHIDTLLPKRYSL